MPEHTPTSKSILFGAAYYAEYHTSDRIEQDLDLMAAAKMNVIRVGESVWSTWEPRNGTFDLEWLTPVLDGALHRGIGVVLGTPTYAVPPWLQVEYPEIAALRATGHVAPWGARQEVNYSHAAFRYFAERVIRRILARHANHPAVIGFQVDNEPGQELPHNHATFTRFVRTLRDRYGDVARLNSEWGLTYWSHRLDDWSELWRPEGNTIPQYDLAWRRFQAAETTEFLKWQAEIVREYSTPEQFVTTCLQYPRPGIDDRELNVALDITAGNPYYGMQDRLDATQELPTHNYWTSSGVAGLFRQADRMFSGKQRRFLVTETNAQAIGESSLNFPPYPGQLTQAAHALVARGASMVEYWHWHTLPFGAEAYWGGVLPHSLVPGRVYTEMSALGQRFQDLSPHVEQYVPDADVAFVWSVPSRYAMQFTPPLSTHGHGDDESYERIVDAFYTGAAEAGLQARIFHMEQLHDLDVHDLVARFPILVAAGLYITTDADIKLLQKYAAAGGHLILGPRTAYADDEARARVDTAPPGLVESAGVHYEEFSNIEAPLRIRALTPALTDEPGAGTLWVDGLIADSARILATYEHHRFGDFAAVTSTEHGEGRITTVGCIPDRTLARNLFAWICPRPLASELLEERTPTVTVSSGLSGAHRVWFVFNWSPEPAPVRVAAPEAVDVTTGERPGTSLAPWSVLTLITPTTTNTQKESS